MQLRLFLLSGLVPASKGGILLGKSRACATMVIHLLITLLKLRNVRYAGSNFFSCPAQDCFDLDTAVFSQLMELQTKVRHFVQAEQAANAQFLTDIMLVGFFQRLEKNTTRLIKLGQEVIGDFDANPALARVFCDQWKFFHASIQEEVNRIETLEIKREQRLLATKARVIQFFNQRLLELGQEGVVEEQAKMETRASFVHKEKRSGFYDLS